jgi:SAM-dependent methyltransferase
MNTAGGGVGAVTGADDDGGPSRPPGAALDRPSIARVYDYVLGGKENFDADRRAGNALLNAVPESTVLAQDNRSLIRRVVRYLVGDVGIKQILDIGSGLPTEGNVHEVVHALDPAAHVVYVDKDPVVLAHARALLSGRVSTVITADLTDPDSILGDPETVRLIDPERPSAVLISGVLHHFPDEADPAGIVARLVERLPAGTYVFLSNFLDDDEPRARALERAFLDGGLGTGRFRTWAEMRPFYDGLELVEPGLVYANDWRPDADTPTDSPVHTLLAGGVGIKRSS